MTSPRVFHLLVVDDDPLIHQSLKLFVSSPWKIFSVSDPDLVPYDRFFHAALVDMHLIPSSKNPVGVQIIEKLVKHHSQLEVIAMSGDLDRDLMEQCLKVGAQRFLPKPLVAEEVLSNLNKIEAYWNLRSLESTSHNKGIVWVGSSPQSQKVQKRIAELRGEMNPLLIEGETGCGKEVVARLLNSQEAERPFVPVNISSIPEALFESELFGHVKGAFTGADQNKVGLAEVANGGDLFLDEIEALPMSQQVKLLRFLESGEVRRVGGKDIFKVQCRVIAASNQPLKKLLQEGKFREDLYFRLNSQRIELPPLRERNDDIPELAKKFLDAERPRRSKQFSADGLEALQNYPWPGNVRELKRVCEQLSLTSPLPYLRREDVEGILGANGATAGLLDFSKGLGLLLEEFEAHVIRQSLKKYPDVEDAAKTLQISRSSLYKKIKDYKIDEDSP